MSIYTASLCHVVISSLFILTCRSPLQVAAKKSSRISFTKTTMSMSRLNLKLPLYYIASITVSIGGLLFGLDTGTIGPVTTMSTFAKTFGQLSPMKHGSIVSTILLPAAFASLFAGNIADTYGRPITIIVGGAIFGIGATLEAVAPKLAVFIFGRVTKGLGEGLFLATVTTYICE